MYIYKSVINNDHLKQLHKMSLSAICHFITIIKAYGKSCSYFLHSICDINHNTSSDEDKLTTLNWKCGFGLDL